MQKSAAYVLEVTAGKLNIELVSKETKRSQKVTKGLHILPEKGLGRTDSRIGGGGGQTVRDRNG